MFRLPQPRHGEDRLPRKAPSDLSLLLAEAKVGSEAARGALFEHHRAYLELLARIELGHRLKNKIDPCDVVQETFLEAHRSFNRFRGEGEFTSWLRTILARRLAHVVRRYVRSQGRDVRREQVLDLTLDRSSRAVQRGCISVQPSPSQRAALREQVVLLAEALGRLPPDYREVVVLRQFEELPFFEISRRMRRSLDSVQKLWARALARLRRELQD
ncbi:MAG TPA: sigma-70 family RNA polymerase sigma factor [Pirellulales bacterium]|nr:sigma-70 family RNA polymerase sigma factor [Pirellulales bacterium]